MNDKDIQKLINALKVEFATKDDLENFATKDDLAGFATKDDLEKLWQKIDDQVVDFRNDIMEHVDAVYKELLAMRDEQSVHTYTHMRQDEKYEDHEKRIRKLEKTSAAS